MSIWDSLKDRFMNKGHKREFVYLWIACILGALAIMPYVHYLTGNAFTDFRVKNFLFVGVNSAVFFGLICLISYFVVKKIDFNPFKKLAFTKSVLYPAITAGVVVALFILLMDKMFFKAYAPAGSHPPFWAGALASIYGGINEEVLLRVFALSLIYLALRKSIRGVSSSSLFWIVNIIVAVLFGLSHLPKAFHIAEASSSDISRALLLNGVAGLVFGYLYFSRNLLTAIIAHFVADVLILAVFR